MAVTRDDVAKRAGVSTAVVSYVVNDGPRPVSKQARERVLAAIAELGYQRHGAAGDLARGKSLSIGLVVPDIGLPYFGRMTQEIASLADAEHRQLLVGTTGWNLEREGAQLRALAERRVDGIILMSVNPAQDLTPLTSLNIPVAIVDRPGFATEGAAAVTAHLLEHGHRRAGMICGPLDRVSSIRRRDGWRRALSEADLPHSDELLEAAPVSQRGGSVAVHALLDRAPDITALFVETDTQALGALRALHERGLRVPEDLALATSDITESGEFAVPSLTGLRQPTPDIAKTAVAAVTEPGSRGVRRLDVHGFHLMRRESCGCVPRVR